MARIAYLPLHHGRAPRWLFEKMRRLSGVIMELIIIEQGKEKVLELLSDPCWFQAFGCVLGFDWHSSGLTTTVMGALKEALKERDLGIWVAGGKGRVARRTPDEVRDVAEKVGLNPEPLIYASRMSAKVDSAGLQDGYELYHHTLVFTEEGKWSVIQQGMNPQLRYARRYHWNWKELSSFVKEPHKGIISEGFTKPLNLVAVESEEARNTITELSKENPEKIERELKRLEELKLPGRHEVELKDINPQRIKRILLSTYENPPEDFERLLGREGIGPRTLRALALISELVYGTPVSYRDPARFSFAHGGKDGHPYPVDRRTYENSIRILEEAVRKAKIGEKEKLFALKKLEAL